ncbi:mitochondrial carrier [Acaromyces ingoldii]|uniref:Mitochondrial carrier n=1 Tax=Acaromyces ingoldii TaxID=215250 RepID=A0A316YQL6_9BASI|nr:mitochondrial carrier [Acaromyces ingoldii]PWN91677.1 mitochondrial carrier [Acaromyces ingoldii]
MSASTSRGAVPSRQPTPLDEEEQSSAAVRTGRQALVLTFASAGLGNSLSAICTNPFDIIKVRQQLAVDRSRASFWSVAASMARNEGVRSWWNGVTASCLREASYSTIRMGSYESFKELYSPLVDVSSFTNKLLAGITSGAIGAAIATPTDLVKVRMQAARPPSGEPPFPNTFVGFARVYQEGAARSSSPLAGLQSLYRGVGPTVVRAAILTSTQIGCYDEAKTLMKARLGLSEGVALHFASSMVAGFVCSAASQPVDVIKVRIMQDKSRQINGAFHSLGMLLRNEGPLALYKGFGMCWARLGTHTVISLVLFERFRALFGIKPL